MSHFSHTKKKNLRKRGKKILKFKNLGLKGHSFTKKRKKKSNLNMYTYQEPETSRCFVFLTETFKVQIPCPNYQIIQKIKIKIIIIHQM